jgi:hypothetical protein
MMRNPDTNPISLFFATVRENHTGLIATILVLTACYLWINEKAVPDLLQNLILIVVSFYFGTKANKDKDEK